MELDEVCDRLWGGIIVSRPTLVNELQVALITSYN